MITISPGIEQENNYFFIEQTNISILQVVDYLKEERSIGDIQHILRLTDQQIRDCQNFIQVNRQEIEVYYQEELRRFANNVLAQLAGVHRPSWKERASAVVGLLIGGFFLYGGLITWNTDNITFFLLPFGGFLCLMGGILTFAQFRRSFQFQDCTIIVDGGLPSKSFTVSYGSIARIKLSFEPHGLQHLFIQNTSGLWKQVYCTDSMKEKLRSLYETEQYDPALHYQIA